MLIGGLAWTTVSRWLSRILSAPVVLDNPYEHAAITVRDESGDRSFSYVLQDAEVVEDVGVFAFGVNPSASNRTLTICGGITTRGVRGSARCFIDTAVREQNEQYVITGFAGASFCCIAMRVPIVNGDALAPELTKPENRLYEWTNPFPGHLTEPKVRPPD